MRSNSFLDPEYAAPVLRHCHPLMRKRLRAALARLAEDPYSTQLDISRLDTAEDQPSTYRLRVGDWRVAYVVDGARILVIKIFHRRDGYGWLERT